MEAESSEGVIVKARQHDMNKIYIKIYQNLPVFIVDAQISYGPSDFS